MQTNPAVEQNKIIRWPESPWNQIIINEETNELLPMDYGAVLFASGDLCKWSYDKCLIQIPDGRP